MLALVCVIGAAALGFDPLWHVEPLTLSEAAALRDEGETIRLLIEGYDPNQRYPVRREFVDADQRAITPLEAAVRSRRATMVQLLLAHGARPDIDTWMLLACSPADPDTTEVRSRLAVLAPSPAIVSCNAMPE
jgi:hypothetical protein